MKKILLVVGIVIVTGMGGFILFGNKKTTTNSAVEGITTTQSQSSNTSNSTQQNTQTKSEYTTNDVASHNSKSDCWTIINDNVYNITSYVPMHPGGVSEIIRVCGKNGTSLFNSNPQHDSRADNELAKLKIGTLAN